MKKKIIVILIVIIMLAGATVGAYYYMHHDKEEARKVKKVDSIKGFDYVLEDRDTKVYQDEFAKLKKNLESKEIDYKEYAKSIAKMFVIDLYTIDNKINKYDVGGTEFIHPDALENYELNVKDTLYKYVEDDSYDDRKQSLPEVKSIKVDSIEDGKFKIKEEDEVDAYEVTLSWDYVQDLEYDNEAKVIIVKKDKYLYIVEKSELTSEKDNTKGE